MTPNSFAPDRTSKLTRCAICDLSDTQEGIIEESDPPGLNKKVSREDERRLVMAIIKAQVME
ncbi:hypothetical protein N9B73_01265 [Verrucomicrobiales bacterium]|jgi:hypothetical protein|nr:hypothetical protein [Verrucomicrobiales bacterium]